MADDHRIGCTRRVVFHAEQAPARRAHSQGRERSRRDGDSCNLHRLVGRANRRTEGAPQSDAFDEPRVILVGEVECRRLRQDFLALARRRREHRDESIRFVVGQRVEQNPLHEAEDGGVGPDAQAQRQDDDRAERGSPAHPAQRETDLTKDVGRGFADSAPTSHGGLRSLDRLFDALGDGATFRANDICGQPAPVDDERARFGICRLRAGPSRHGVPVTVFELRGDVVDDLELGGRVDVVQPDLSPDVRLPVTHCSAPRSG